MVEGKVRGMEGGHKELHLEPSKLLVNEDVKAVLMSTSYLSFLELFHGFDVNVSHQMVTS